MDTTPISAGVLEGLDRLAALATRPETRDAVVELKRRYTDRSAHESRVRAAREELQAAEAGLLDHGHPREPVWIVNEEVLADLDARLHALQAARAKFREGQG